VVSAKCKGAVKSYPGDRAEEEGEERERERERNTVREICQWVHPGSIPMMQERAYLRVSAFSLLQSDHI